MKLAIITDSGSGLSKKEAAAAGIYFLPLQIINNEEEYRDQETITTEEVFALLHKGDMPTTSMPTMGSMERLIQQLKEDGYEEAIAVTLSGGLSSTAQVLYAVSKEQDFLLHVVEPYTTCNIQRYLALSAKQLADQGLEAKEIVQRLNDSIASSNTLIIPDDLQHLKRGGRLTPLAAALGGLLKIKPILKLNTSTEGKIDVADKVRTMSKAYQSAVDTFAAEGITEDYMLSVLHTDAQDTAEKVQDLMKERFPNNDIYFGWIGATISCHTGIGCIGIQYVKKVKGV